MKVWVVIFFQYPFQPIINIFKNKITATLVFCSMVLILVQSYAVCVAFPAL